jgi:hypothetical protein
VTTQDILQFMGNYALPILSVLYLIGRQFMWRQLKDRPQWRAGIIFGIVGVVLILQQPELISAPLSAVDLGMMVLECAVSFGIGILMGRMTVYRVIDDRVELRTPPIGILLWVVFIAVRIGLVMLADGSGAVIAASGSFILISLAFNRLARGFVIESQRAKHTPSGTATVPVRSF